MINFISKTLCLIALVMTLQGCMPDKCIDADDFGFARFTVSARYNSAQIVGTQENEVGPWRDTGFTTNGKPLTIVVKNWSYSSGGNTTDDVSAWSPWYGTSSDGDTTGGTFNKINGRFPTCLWLNNIMNTPTRYAMIINAPCLFHRGVGLYGLVATRNIDPNATVSAAAPDGMTFHVGDPSWQANYTLFDISSDGTVAPAGGLVYQFSSSDSSTHNGSKLYFKILDKYYDDNSGQYRIVIKSGINDPYPDPFQYITALVKNQFFGDPNDTSSSNAVVKNIYLQVIKNNEYKTFISSMLILYVMFTAFSFLIGVLEITNMELVTRILKVAVVAALLDPNYGWSFFYDYLFIYFINGTDELIHLIQQAANSGGGSDSLVTLLLAPETLAKVMALLFTSATGIIYIIVYIALLVFFMFISFRMAALYVTALVMIGMIIIMGPIFISFALFGFTKSLFENWLKQLMYYTLQPIILLTSIAFMSMLIRHEIYATLGYKVCRYDFPDLGPLFQLVSSATGSSGVGSSTPTSIFFWFFPVPMTGSGFSNAQYVIPVPEAHFQLNPDGTLNGTLCAAYGCNENRYVDLPFLDPYSAHDMERRSNFLLGSFTQFENLVYLVVLIYLLYRFNDSAVSISKALNNASANATNTQHAAEAARQGVTQFVDKHLGISEGMHKATAPIRQKWRDFKFEVENNTTARAARAFEEWSIKGMANDALGAGAVQSVLDEVKLRHNIDRKDINVNAKKDYEAALAGKLNAKAGSAISGEEISESLRFKDPAMGQDHGRSWRRDFSEEGLSKLIKGRGIDIDAKDIISDSVFKDALAKKSFGGKTFDQLSDKEKTEIAKLAGGSSVEEIQNLSHTKRQEILAKELFGKDKLSGEQMKELGAKSLKDLATDAEETQKFQDLYIQTHQEMSNKGYGYFGKRSAAFRTAKDFETALSAKSTGFFSKAAQTHRGDLISSGLDSVKHALSGGLVRPDSMEFDYKSNRMQTYQEQLAEESRRMAYENGAGKRMNEIINMNGRDVFRTEFLAKMPGGEARRELEALRDQELAYEVHKMLTEDVSDKKAPALMGERYMKEGMEPADFEAAIAKTEELQKKFKKESKYLNLHKKDMGDSQIVDERRIIEAKVDKLFENNIKLLQSYKTRKA